MNFFLDLDGTLLESRPRLHMLFCDLSAVEIDFTDYWNEKREGRSNQQLLKDRYQRSDNEIAQFTADWMRLIESPQYLAMDRPFDYSGSAVEALARLGRIRILTARQNEAAARAQVSAAGFDPFIADVLVTGGSITKEMFCRAQDFYITTNDCFVGDTGDDIALARAFGCKAIAVSSGFRSLAYLEARAPDALFDNIAAFAAQATSQSGIDRDGCKSPSIH